MPEKKKIVWTQTDDFTYRTDVMSEWKENDWLITELTVTEYSIARVMFTFYRKTGEKSIVISQKIQTNMRIVSGFPLSCLTSKGGFLIPRPGQLKSGVRGEPVTLSELSHVTMEVVRMDRLEKVEIHDSYVTDTPAFPIAERLLVDEMGQIAIKDWKGKFHSTDELTAHLRQRRTEAKNEYPAGFSRWGGWLAKKFDATGFFHRHHDGRRWWLVDPDGYAFLSNGVCYGNRMGIYSMTYGQENLCAYLPDRNDSLYREAYMEAADDPEFAKRYGVENGKNVWMFNFARANMIRAFGGDWWNAWADINGSLLKSWGMNTLGVGVGNYPDERTYEYIKKVRIPFVLSLTKFPKPENCLFRDFPDVYDPLYTQMCTEYAKQLLPYRDEPLLIGYFLTNEPEWLFVGVSLTRVMLKNRTAPYTRAVFMQSMREKYRTVEALNAAWNAHFVSFDGLNEPVPDSFLNSEEAVADMETFDNTITNLYAKIPSEALAKVAPNHLNLGMRYSGYTPRTAAGSENYDVFSFNCYQTSPTERATGAAATTHLPLMIGEWHFCGYDRGLLCSGLVQSESQSDRAKSIRYYIEQAFANTDIVGIHYFEYSDQPALGRFDGASGQSGLVDVCDEPYEEVDAALRTAAKRFYPIADGQIPPTDEKGIISAVRFY